MGWFDKIVSGADLLWRTDAKEWTFTNVPSQFAGGALPADEYYVSLFLEGVRVRDLRRGWKTYYGVAHSFASLAHEASPDGRAKFHAFIAPGELKNIDGNRLDRVVISRQRLMGPTPYRGGDLGLELGLFAMEGRDFAAPLIGILESITTVAGVSFSAGALPYLGIIERGVGALTGAGGARLEIGLVRTFATVEPGLFLLMATPRGTVDANTLRLGANGLESAGKQLPDAPYLLFSLSAEKRRDDFFSIPDIASAYGAVVRDIREGRPQAALEPTVQLFKRVVRTSPDLLPADADRLIQKVDALLVQTRSAQLTAAKSGPPQLPPLGSIDPFTP